MRIISDKFRTLIVAASGSVTEKENEIYINKLTLHKNIDSILFEHILLTLDEKCFSFSLTERQLP